MFNSLLMPKIVSTLILFIVLLNHSFSQEQRLTDYNFIGWLAYTGVVKIRPKISIHTEYQWRRVDGIKNRQQNLLRTGVNYAVEKNITITAGYAFAETFAYGDYPGIASFPEHRIYEQITLKNQVGKVQLSHRYTLEQRIIGKITIRNNQQNIDWLYLNRIRFRLRTDIPISKKNIAGNVWNITFFDEIFIGWGKNIGENIFDQNRVAVLLGYQVTPNLKIEAGFLNQILQQGKRVNDKSVFQFNNGGMISANFSFDLVKKS